MEAKAVDPTEFREGQRTQWNKAASGWRKWSDLIDASAGAVSRRLVELAGVEPGSRVLDVAAGYGEPSMTAAMAAAPDGGVVATDISAEMLAFGRERSAAAGVTNIEFVESGAQDLDFPEAQLRRGGLALGHHLRARRRGRGRKGSRLPEARSADGDQLLGPAGRTCPSWRSRCERQCRSSTSRRHRPGTPGPLSRPTHEALGGLLEGGGFSGVAGRGHGCHVHLGIARGVHDLRPARSPRRSPR